MPVGHERGFTIAGGAVSLKSSPSILMGSRSLLATLYTGGYTVAPSIARSGFVSFSKDVGGERGSRLRPAFIDILPWGISCKIPRIEVDRRRSGAVRFARKTSPVIVRGVGRRAFLQEREKKRGKRIEGSLSSCCTTREGRAVLQLLKGVLDTHAVQRQMDDGVRQAGTIHHRIAG